jgi:hypothetical protein
VLSELGLVWHTFSAHLTGQGPCDQDGQTLLLSLQKYFSVTVEYFAEYFIGYFILFYLSYTVVATLGPITLTITRGRDSIVGPPNGIGDRGSRGERVRACGQVTANSCVIRQSQSGSGSSDAIGASGIVLNTSAIAVRSTRPVLGSVQRVVVARRTLFQ